MNNYAVAYGGASVVGGGTAPSSSLAPSGAVLTGGGAPFVPGPGLGDCHHIKPDGDFCGRRPKKGSDYCPLHKRAGEALDHLDAALAETD